MKIPMNERPSWQSQLRIMMFVIAAKY